MKLSRITATIGILGIFALAACSSGETPGTTQPDPSESAPAPAEGDLQALIDAAKAEGSVTWYSSITQEPTERAAAAFQEKYGITVEVARIGSELLSPRYAQERAAGDVVADLITIPEDFRIDEFVEEGWIEPLTDDLPSVAEFPVEYIYNDNSYALVNVQPIGYLYNTDMAESEPTGWEDIFDPEFQDAIVLADPGAILAWTELFRVLEEEFGVDYLTRFADMGYQVQPSAVPASQQVAAGESKIAFPSNWALANALTDQGAPVKLVVPDMTTGINQYIAMSTDSDSPNAAKLLMNWLLSVEGQSVLNEGQAASVLPNVPGAVDLPAQFIVPDLRMAQDARDGILKNLGL